MSVMSIEDFILIAVFGVISCLLLISIEQICISSTRKRGIRFRIFLCIALITEIIIIFIHYFSLFTTTINTIWVTTNAIFWFSMFTLSFVVHKLVPAPKLYAKEKLSVNLNRIWKFISIVHFLWLSVCCLAFFITKDGIYYESIYNFGFLSYLIIGSVLLIIISYNVRLTIKETMKKMDVSSVNNFQDYIYNNDDDQSSDTANSANSSSNGEQGGHKKSKSKKKHHKSKVSEAQAKVLSPIDEMNEKPGYDFARKNGNGQNGGHNPRLSSVTSNNLVEPMNQMLQLSKAKYVLTLSILVSVGVGLIALMALYWSIVSFIKAGHENLILFGTYNNQTFFWFHYVFIVLLYIAAMIYHWKPFKSRSRYSLCRRIKRGCCSKTRGKFKGFRKKRVYSVSALSSNGKSTPIATTSNNNNNKKTEPFNAENGYNKDEMVTIEIEEANHPTSPGREYAEEEMDENDVVSPAVQSADLLEPAKNLRDLISYTNQGANQLSINQMKLSLNKINSKGNVIGKRGKSKPKKLRDEHKNKGYNTPIDKMEKRTEIVNKLEIENQITERERPAFDDNITDYSESDDDEKYHRRRDSDSFDPKDLLTRTTAKWRNVELTTTMFTATTTHHKSQDTEELAEDIVDELLYLEEEAAKPKVNVVVFEFGNVICTNIDKLHEKMVTYVETMTKTQKELCFGGEERLEMLRNFFKDLHQNDKEIKTFIIADEQSKMLVKLLNDTNLLKYFVSKNPKKPSKLLSHVIGWDHKIAKQADGKKHLILLKLLQFLQKSHDELLYIGNDKQIVSHLNNIKCCKTFHCETKGLTHDALQKMHRKYFK